MKKIKINYKSLLPYILIIIGFIVIAYAYTPQVLQGKIVNQSDISSWNGMANEIKKHNEAHPDDKTLWTNSMFSGMPAFSILVDYEGDYTKPFYKFLLTGARPASYLLISLIGGFLLFLAFGTNVYVAAIGAIAVTFCSYNMQIIQVGHNTKMQAIAFMPWVLAAVVYAYRKKSLWGAILFAIALSFQIKANHPQITYYLAIIILGFAIAEFCGAIRKKLFPKFLKTSLLLLTAGLLGIGANANHLMPTYEYAKHTMRGGSELSHDKENQTKGGLKLDYATAWSYGIEETPNLMIPNFNGGSSYGSLDRDSHTYKAIKGKYQGAEEIIKQLPLYWGPQPFTAGPMYLGAIMIFLFVLGLIVIRGRYKWWIAGVSLLALLLAWGSNFMWFSELFFKYAPLYNKFRTVSMALTVLQITVPLLGILLVNELLFKEGAMEKKRLKQGLLIALGITGGVSLLVALFPSLAGSFTSPADASLPSDISDALALDRKALLRGDAFRSLLFILFGAAVLWAGYLKKLNPILAVALLGGLILVDMWGIDKRYLNESHFVRKSDFSKQFAKRKVDEIILQDKDLNYRVLDLSVNTFNDAHTSYHHKTIGGYSPAKLQRYQDLIDHYISQEMSGIIEDFNTIAATAKSMEEVEKGLRYHPILSMLNTKYIVYNGEAAPLNYPSALGNAWFVSEVVTAANADEEIALLGGIDPARSAIVNPEYEKSSVEALSHFATGEIELTHYAPNHLKYRYSADKDGLALFSEIYYPAGWRATVDGKESKIYRANYALRAMMLPEGSHEIEFHFAPASVTTGKNISVLCSGVLLLALALLLGFESKRRSLRKENLNI